MAHTELTAGKILQTYYALRAERGTKAPAFFRERVWDHAEAFLVWCAKSGISDPLAFLDFRFQKGDRASYIPRLDKLRSNNLAEIFNSEWKQFEIAGDIGYQKLKQRMGTKQEQAVKELMPLTHGMDAVKHPYWLRGRSDICLAEISLTGGFHPDSRYCAVCPMAVRCAAKLYQIHGFDVVALRAGRLRDLPREIAAAAIR